MMIVPRVKKVWDKRRTKQLVGTIEAITVFVIFLVKWKSTLENEAKKRAQKLYEPERKAIELENSYDAVKQYLGEVLELTESQFIPGLLVDYANRFQT